MIVSSDCDGCTPKGQWFDRGRRYVDARAEFERLGQMTTVRFSAQRPETRAMIERIRTGDGVRASVVLLKRFSLLGLWRCDAATTFPCVQSAFVESYLATRHTSSADYLVIHRR
jgi:hypothetical protein